MAAAIKDKYNVESELIADGGGIFNVYLNGEIIFDKQKQCGNFPEHQEIIDLIAR